MDYYWITSNCVIHESVGWNVWRKVQDRAHELNGTAWVHGIGAAKNAARSSMASSVEVVMGRPQWASMRRPQSEAPKAEHRRCISAEDHEIINN